MLPARLYRAGRLASATGVRTVQVSWRCPASWRSRTVQNGPEQRRYVGIDVLTRARNIVTNHASEEATTLNPPALTA